MRRHREKGGMGTALVAALLLVIQVAVGAMAPRADAAPRDIYGNPICITHGGDAPDPGPGGHRDGSDCCTLCTVSGIGGPLPDGPALAAPLSLAVRRPAPESRPVHAERRRRSPANPRAPPSA